MNTILRVIQVSAVISMGISLGRMKGGGWIILVFIIYKLADIIEKRRN